jgi:hypothetical protein
LILTSTFKTKDNLLGSLGLLVENGLGLTTITGLLTVITSLTLGEERSLTSLVLGDLVRSVLSALDALTEGVTCLGNVDLFNIVSIKFFEKGEPQHKENCKAVSIAFVRNLQKENATRMSRSKDIHFFFFALC